MVAMEHCIQRTRAYALERQFRCPLASFQLVQKKFVDAQTEVVLGLLESLQVMRLKDGYHYSIYANTYINLLIVKLSSAVPQRRLHQLLPDTSLLKNTQSRITSSAPTYLTLCGNGRIYSRTTKCHSFRASHG